MKKNKPKPHPYHYWEDKNFMQKFIDWALPSALLSIYFLFYNFGKITPSEVIKTSGLMSIMLLSITLFVGPASRFISPLNAFKAHRKFWGIASFLFLLVHAGMVIVFYLKFDIFRALDPESTRYMAYLTGVFGLLILSLITLSSNQTIMHSLPPGLWKKLQTSSYIALTLAVLHFYLMEQQDGVLVIKRLLGNVTFWFATVVIVVRALVVLFPTKKSS